MLRIPLNTERNQAYAAKQVLASPVGANLEVVVQKIKRTNKQNNYFWQCMTLLGDYLGYTKKEMHDIVCDEFLEPITIEFRGKTIERPGETSRLNTKEMAELIDKLHPWAVTEFNYILPRPDDNLVKTYAET